MSKKRRKHFYQPLLFGGFVLGPLYSLDSHGYFEVKPGLWMLPSTSREITKSLGPRARADRPYSM